MTIPAAITAERLRALCPHLTLDEAETHAGALDAARPIASLTTTARVRHFLAQCAHETGGFRRLTENLNYRKPAQLDALFSAVRGEQDARMLIGSGPKAIANRVYANRGGNGDELSGDGWRWRGRGYLQITLKDNYVQMEKVSRLPLTAQPDLLEDPVNAAKAAAWYWRWHAINTPADRDDTRGVTREINPYFAGLDDRIAWVGRARAIWP